MAALCLAMTIPFSAAAEEPATASTEAKASASGWDSLSTNDKGGIVGLGVSALLLGTATYSYYHAASLGDEAGFKAYRDGIPADNDACDAAASGTVAGTPGAYSPEQVSDACASSSRWSTAGHVMAAGGVVALGVSIAALVWPEADKDTDSASVKLVPVVSDRGSTLQVNVTF